MPITDEDISASMKARGTIAILQAKMQDIINKSENQLQKKREDIVAIEAQRDADLTTIGAKIKAEENAIKALIGNV
jgi:Skp family chaperone for outer membrane proteins